MANGQNSRTIAAIAEAMAERRERERLEREERGRRASAAPSPDPVPSKAALVNEHAAQHSDYAEQFMPDLSVENQGKPRMLKVVRNKYPMIVDRWFDEGGPGFEEPQRRAVDHCIYLWGCLGTQRLCANYTGMSGGGQGDGHENEIFARRQLGHYRDEFMSYWDVFENVVRFGLSAGTAASHLQRQKAQQVATAKACVGMIASQIAMARGYNSEPND